jgi:ubiquinone/menaquinone biosynthesis C-methylase UbiE
MQPYSDHEILEAVNDYMFSSDNPDLVGYRTQSLDRDLANKQIFMWHMRQICALGNLRNKRVLDVGCGFGWQALAISMIGNNTVIANDILPSMIDGANDCVKKLREKGVRFDVTPLLGDICNLSLEPNSLDAIYSLEAVEHVHDIGQMFDSCARLLKKNGRLIVVNDCNVLSRSVKNDCQKMWLHREESWEWARYLKSIRPLEHGEARPFSVMRREIIENVRPELNESSVQAIAKATAGLLKADIEKIAVDYHDGYPLPEVPKLDWCRNPLTGEFAERLLDPFEMAEMLESRNFVVKVRHGFRKLPFRYLNSIQFKPINLLLFNLRPLFILVAVKRPA